MSSSTAVPPSHFSTDPVVERLGINASLRPTVSWQAVFAGAVIALAIELLLAVLGLAVGLTVVNPGQGGGGANGLGLAAAIWWIVSCIISLFIGSYAGARLANVPSRYDGLLQGLVIWGVGVLVSVWVLGAAATGLVHGVVTALGGTISAVGQGIESTAPQIASALGTNQGGGAPSGQQLQDQARLLFEPQNPEPQQMSRDQAVVAVAKATPDLLAGGDKAAAAKDRISAIIAAQLKISQADAEQRVDQFQQRVEQAKTQAAQTAKNAASQATGVASDAAYAIFVALIVTAIGAGLGGSMARPRRVLRRNGQHWRSE
jgi:hypothetical protein